MAPSAAWVKTMKYLDTPFYHYFIGRDGQSVQTDVMIRRVDQLRLVNQCMVRATPERGTVPDGLYRYMIHFLAIESSVASVFMILSRDPENYEKKKDMWDDIKAYSPTIYKDVRKKAMSRALNLRSRESLPAWEAFFLPPTSPISPIYGRFGGLSASISLISGRSI